MNLPNPQERRAAIMTANGTCTVCGWRERVDNGPELHAQHVAHLLEAQHHEIDHQQVPVVVDRDTLVATLGRTHNAPRRKAGATGPIGVWMSLDPETRRVAVQTHEPQDGDLPRGPRGVDWLWRQHEIDGDEWARLLAGGYTPTEQDTMHRRWWTEAGTEGDPAWPLLPGEE